MPADRCPTCDREECGVAAAEARTAAVTIPVTPGKNGCDCKGTFARDHNPARGCGIHGNGQPELEAAWATERSARVDCAAHAAEGRERIKSDAAKWRRVEPMIERLRVAADEDTSDTIHVVDAAIELLAAAKEPS